MEYPVTILQREPLTHNVVRLTLERPKDYFFTVGQAIDFKLARPEVKDKVSPFTFTGLNMSNYLELTIKCYPEHHGLTAEIAQLRAGDEVIISEPFDTVTLQGPGVFIAGGTGVTPFIAILRQLHHLRATKGCTLLLTNRTVDDVILDQELTRILGERHFLKVFTRQGVIGFKERRIDRDLLVTLVQDFDQKFYVCGPADFVKDINALLLELGASAQSLVFEQ